MNTDDHNVLIHAIVEFVGLLRKAGLKLGPDITLKSTEALVTLPPASHQDLYWTLYACMLTNQDQQEIFDQVFALYWGHAKLPDSALAISLPRSKIKSRGEKSFSQRTLDAFKNKNQPPENSKTEIEKLHLSWSDQEHLEHMDFESMSSEDYLKAQKLLTRLKIIFNPVTTRRYKKAPQKKKIDFRNTLKHSTRMAGQLIALKYKKPQSYFPSVLMLIDISGSMSRYAQIMLQFAYLLNKSRSHVHVFVFATRRSAVIRIFGSAPAGCVTGAVSAPATGRPGKSSNNTSPTSKTRTVLAPGLSGNSFTEHSFDIAIEGRLVGSQIISHGVGHQFTLLAEYLHRGF